MAASIATSPVPWWSEATEETLLSFVRSATVCPAQVQYFQYRAGPPSALVPAASVAVAAGVYAAASRCRLSYR